MDYESYLISKKIDSAAFRQAEPELWKEWNLEFEQMHPDSFTMQKLNLINPVRRKYTLLTPPQKVEEASEKLLSTEEEIKPASTPSVKPKPIMAKPVFKPKPKP